MEQKRTLDEILLELVEVLEDPMGATMDKKVETRVFIEMHPEDWLDYLKVTLNADVRRYFAASTDEERAQVKGAFSRTAYLRGMLVKANRNLQKGQ